jgi:molybdopterin molybdotransferase
MDGYALRSQDVTTAPTTLRVIGEVAAGAVFSTEIGPGEAVKIFTGAPIPLGADAVQQVELTETDGNLVVIKEPVRPGQFITPRASEVSRGEIVARAGKRIGPPEMAVLASFGYSEVAVSRRPRVAVLSTGNELVEVSEVPCGGQIRNSNTYTITSYAEQEGAIARVLPSVGDNLAETRSALLSACEGSDAVVTSGGVSMGDYDLVKAALTEIRAEVFFDKVIVRPGKPVVFARRGDVFFFGLPGNPVSVSVTFNLFVRPALRRMMGYASIGPVTIQAVASRPIRDPSNRRSYLPGRLSFDEGRVSVAPLKWGGSSDLVAFMAANALIVVPEEIHDVAEGSLVEVIPLEC